MRFLTAGESHGPELVAIIEGLPAGLRISTELVERELARRQKGYGRGRRMQIEQDRIRWLSGIRHGYTLGSPVAFSITNRDWPHWEAIMSASPPEPADLEAAGKRRLACPRPGHADLAGGMKYGHRDLRNVLERASARETAARVAVGAIVRQLLAHFGVRIASLVVALGDVVAAPETYSQVDSSSGGTVGPLPISSWWQQVEESPVRCPDPDASQRMMAAIDRAREAGDTLGGVFQVVVEGLPPGLGSHVQWDRRLDARLAAAVMSIPAIKGVEVGIGFAAGSRPGSQVHDAIAFDPQRGVYRLTNRAGGLEGGMTNGEPLWLRAVMKPIATLMRPLPSVHIDTGESAAAAVERSDVCALPAAAVVGEAMVGWELARAWVEKFGGDSLAEMEQNVRNYKEALRRYIGVEWAD
ncbi:MAG: chorismate synthase [Limnochordales bacterium]|nr:chorismate synthase [Limnochordales bacterium]